MSLNIYEYQDYRSFLSDFYKEKKRKVATFSYRIFAAKAGIGSPSHFLMIVNGKRNLSEKSLEKFSSALSLNEKEKKYFNLLVKYNQAGTTLSKHQYYEELLKLRSPSKLKSLDLEKYEFLSTWYMVVIYVLVGTKSFNSDPKILVKKLRNRITTAQATESLRVLENLSLISKSENGKYQQTQGAVSTDDDTKSMAVFNYHKNMIQLSLESLAADDPDKREMNGATLQISKEKLPELKEKVRKFRKEINELTSSYADADEVYQLNIQLFALTGEDQ